MYPNTIPGLYHRQIARFGSRILAHSKDETTQRWTAFTWEEGARESRALMNGLLALGIERGDRVGIVSETRREWSGADIANVCAGAITVGVYPTSTPEQAGYILNHAEVRVTFVEDRHQYVRLADALAEIPSLEKIVLFEGAEAMDASNVLSIQELLDLGTEYGTSHPDAYEQRWRSVEPEDTAMLVYTSGTTGPPKGVMLTHNNIYATVESALEALPAREDDLGVVFLPLAHSLQRVAGYVGMCSGSVGVYAERLDKIIDHMQEFKPTVQPAVPRIYEKVHARIMGQVENAPKARKLVFRWALDVGRTVARLKRLGKPVPPHMKMQWRAADRLVFQRIRDVFGGRIRYMISGAAPISVELLEFFHACGVLILEGYGLTETTAPATVNRIGHYKFGTVGTDLSICETRIAEDGEILIRGANVFKGYYRDEEATANAFTEDGWFRSGDLGSKDRDGFLRITGRKKEIIVTAGGKNVSPANIENLVTNSPLISQCVVVGDRRKFLVALITLDLEELELMADSDKLEGSTHLSHAQNPTILGEVQLVIDRVNRSLARYETIKYFRVIEQEFSIEDDLMTPTMKLKRRHISARYETVIEDMYSTAKAPKRRPGDVVR